MYVTPVRVIIPVMPAMGLANSAMPVRGVWVLAISVLIINRRIRWIWKREQSFAKIVTSVSKE